MIDRSSVRIFGADVPGKKPSVLFYLGGPGNYRSILREIADKGYPGFEITGAGQTLPV